LAGLAFLVLLMEPRAKANKSATARRGLSIRKKTGAALSGKGHHRLRKNRNKTKRGFKICGKLRGAR